MTKINYKSDFDFILRLKDCADPKKTVPFPDGNFDARFWTSSKANAYTASYRDGAYTNCFRTEDGGMHFVFDDHRMGKGTLHWEPHFELPNDIYPDNMQDLYRKAALDIELVDGDGDCPTAAELEAMLPYIKGEPFTYEDFTAEEIKELQQPATQAAEDLKEFQTQAEKKESEREAAETKRISAEELRESAEAQRASAEASRESAEDTRVSHETTRCYSEESRSRNEVRRCDFEKERVANEKARVSAEESRAQAETSRVSAEQSRATAESTRESNETTRSTNEQSRVSAEETRISNEQTRTSSETSRASAEQTRTTNEQSRQQAETARAEAEAQRASEFAAWHDEITSKQGALSVSEDLSLSADNELSLTDSAKRAVFNDMFNSEGNICNRLHYSLPVSAKYDPENAPDASHPYWCNKIWLTYEEAMDAYNHRLTPSASPAGAIRQCGPLRTVICSFHTILGEKLDFSSTFHSLSKLEVARLSTNDRQGVWVSNMQEAFYGCSKLKEIMPTIIDSTDSSFSWNAAFAHCAELESFQIKELSHNLNLQGSPKLSLATMQYLVDNASTAITAEKPVVVTVHADVFAKLTGDTTNPAVAALTPAELAQWQQILTAATAKNISFTTP